MKLHFFEKYIDKLYDEGLIENNVPDKKGNVMLCCPFEHTKEELDPLTWETKEVKYYEKIPSSSINLEMGVFHCFTCDRVYNEVEFAQALTGKSKDELIKESVSRETLKTASQNWRDMQHKHLIDNVDVINKLHELKITDNIIDELNLGYVTNCLAIPVFKDGDLVNVVRYNINKIEDIPKVRYNQNTNSGDIVPFDICVSKFIK